MLPIVLIGCVLLLLVIVYQDFKYQAVSWYIFPALFVCFFAKSQLQLSFKSTLILTITNLIIVVVIYCSLLVYVGIKQKKINLRLDGFLGLGDILFFVAISPAFASLNFIFFLVIGLLLSLIYTPIHLLVFKQKIIPLAGILGVYYAILFVMEYLSTNISLLNDNYISALLSWNNPIILN